MSQVKQDHLHSLSGSFLLPGWDVNFSFSQRGNTTDVHHSLFRISAAWFVIIFHVNFQNNKSWITHNLSYLLYLLFKQQSTVYLNALVMYVKVNSIFFKLHFEMPALLLGNIYKMLKVVISGYMWIFKETWIFFVAYDFIFINVTQFNIINSLFISFFFKSWARS